MLKRNIFKTLKDKNKQNNLLFQGMRSKKTNGTFKFKKLFEISEPEWEYDEIDNTYIFSNEIRDGLNTENQNNTLTLDRSSCKNSRKDDMNYNGPDKTDKAKNCNNYNNSVIPSTLGETMKLEKKMHRAEILKLTKRFNAEINSLRKAIQEYHQNQSNDTMNPQENRFNKVEHNKIEVKNGTYISELPQLELSKFAYKPSTHGCEAIDNDSFLSFEKTNPKVDDDIKYTENYPEKCISRPSPSESITTLKNESATLSIVNNHELSLLSNHNGVKSCYPSFESRKNKSSNFKSVTCKESLREKYYDDTYKKLKLYTNSKCKSQNEKDNNIKDNKETSSKALQDLKIINHEISGIIKRQSVLIKEVNVSRQMIKCRRHFYRSNIDEPINMEIQKQNLTNKYEQKLKSLESKHQLLMERLDLQFKEMVKILTEKLIYTREQLLFTESTYQRELIKSLEMVNEVTKEFNKILMSHEKKLLPKRA
ncbi:unnamed protein product [Gordionus sp. m RMFG-2023]|uniref:probable serine/threonine-protein kinase DDB_G0282963 n=1 Tax=Gordionus sp. m RMFG-2023 TaxID=3053472 RepID=UPI0030E30BC2